MPHPSSATPTPRTRTGSSTELLRAPHTVTIQKAAVLTGVAQHTLRWYERVGLVPDVERCPTGRRRYSGRNLHWIRILRALRATGMPVATLKELTRHHSGGDTDRPARIVQQHRAQLLALLTQVQQSLAVLDRVEGELAPARGVPAPDPR